MVNYSEDAFKNLLNLKRILFFLLIFFKLAFWLSQNLECQNIGFFYFRNHSPEDYDHYPQNWSIIQDKRGLIFVANQNGVLEYDGVSWRIIYVPNKTVRSISSDKSGTIYIGGVNEIGFFNPDSKGALHYVSLMEHLDNNKRNFSRVWRINTVKEGIYFRTSKFLFRWDSENIKIWEPAYGFNASFTCEGKLLIHQRKIGLMHIVNDSIELVAGGKTLAAVKVYMLAPYDNKRALIGTRSKGFFLYNGKTAMSFPTQADDYLKEKQLSHGIRLASGDFALATLRGGLVIMDSQGSLKQVFTKAYGLVDDNVKYVFEDFQGNLWLALSKGIAKIEYASPITTYDERANLPGIVLSVVRHGPFRDLYAGTTNGLFLLQSTNPGKFVPVPEMTSNCWSLFSVGNSLLAATSAGVFQLKNNIKQKVSEPNSYVFFRSKIEPNRIWVGTRQGLISLFLKKDRWVVEHKFQDITDEIRTIVEDKKGNLWLGSRSRGVLNVDFPGDGTNNPIVTRFDKSHGLPRGEVHVYKAAGHVMFATGKGIFRFDDKNKVFIPDTTLGAEFADGSKSVFRIVEDKNRNIWFHSKGRNLLAIPRPDGSFVLIKKPFLRIPVGGVNAIYPDSDITWFAGNKGLISYDRRVKKNCDLDFYTIIREVSVNGTPLFYDAEKIKYKTGKGGYWKEGLIPVIPYKDRNIRFEFAAPFFEAESETKYQYRLEGYEEDWSAWTSETKKDYTNLDSGLLKFRVRAKNVYENISREAVFKFQNS